MPVSNKIQLPVGHSSFPNLPETKKITTVILFSAFQEERLQPPVVHMGASSQWGFIMALSEAYGVLWGL